MAPRCPVIPLHMQPAISTLTGLLALRRVCNAVRIALTVRGLI